MPNAFKTVTGAVSATINTEYTTPGSTTSIVHGVHISNIHASNDGTIDIVTNDGGGDIHIVKDLLVANAGGYVHPKPINLEDGDTFRLKADAASTLEYTLSILEIT